MSRRGNCHDNAAQKAFSSYSNAREVARNDVFNYIAMFYNSWRRHGFNNQLSPVAYETRHQKRLASV